MEPEFTPLSNAVWARRVAAAAALPDQRLNSRLSAIIADALDSPFASIPQATGGDAGQAKATYRFYGNPRVTSAHLNQGTALETAERCLEHEAILVVQDTTTLNFTGLQRIAELGPIDSGYFGRGMHVHSTLAITVGGRVLGPLDQQCWARSWPAGRPAGRTDHDKKESAKWLYGLEQARQALFEAAGERPLPRLIHVMDREGDTYEVLMAIDDGGDSAIIRSVQNRRVDGPLSTAHQAVRNQPIQAQATVPVNRQGRSPERVATVEIRALTATLLPDRSKYPHAWPMTWHLVEVWEPAPPAGVEPLHWLLWTRESIATPGDSLQVVEKYTGRWPIEEFHLVLKSGCQVEKLRLDTWERLEKAVRVNSAVAARIVLLRDVARVTPAAPALQVLQAEEVAALVNHFTKGKPWPAEQLTIGQAIQWIGRLGGHLNRKKDGMPGVRTLWRGLQALTLLVAGFRAGFRAGQQLLE
jgi:hypothetical protein